MNVRARFHVVLILSFSLAFRTAQAHPHPGGLVVEPDGTILVGDVIQSRILVRAPTGGGWRAITGVGHVRELEQAADHTIYGVSQGSGFWKLGPDDRPTPILPRFHGLFTRAANGTLFLAPADPLDRRPQLEVLPPDGRRSVLARFGQIEALLSEGDSCLLTEGTALRRVAPDGTTTTLAEKVGHGLLALARSPEGLVVAAYHDRSVFLLGPDGSRKLLLTSEPPWGPTDVAFDDGALYVVEVAQYPCCWKGPRLRKQVPGKPVEILLNLNDESHVHPISWILPGGAFSVVLLLVVLVLLRVRRHLNAR